MEHRLLAVLVSSLVSQALILLLLSLPLTVPPSTVPNLLLSSSLCPPTPNPLLPLLLQLLSSTHFAAAASSLLPRKRKRQETPQEAEADDFVVAQGDAQSTALALAPAPRPNPDHFSLCFRMTASTFEWLSGLLDPLLDCRDPRPGPPLPLPGPARLALALSRLATGASYPDLARQFSVPVPAARFLAKHLCRVLCTNFRFWIAFPAPPDLDPVDNAFCSLSGGLTGCCGAVACTRFDAHCGPLAAQVVTDASSRILSITAGFRSDRMDSAVLRCSTLYKDIESGRLLGPSQYLVGASGYPLLPWLMVPFAQPVHGSCEEDFNAVHRLMCRPVLKAISSLRNWGVLSCLSEEEDAKVAVACIGTCAILHNVLLMREDYSALSDAPMECPASSEQYKKDTRFDEFATERTALVVRSTLAVRARAIHDSSQLVCNL